MKQTYAEVVRERDDYAAKLEKVAALVRDLSGTSNDLVAQALDNILSPCECPGEHCGECGCCP